MKNVVFDDVICDRQVIVQKHTKPYEYFTGYIRLQHTDPRIWLDKVDQGDYDYFNNLKEFHFLPEVTYAGNLGMDGEWWVGFDTASFAFGEYEKEDCIEVLSETAKMLEIRNKAVADLKVGQLLQALRYIVEAKNLSDDKDYKSSKKYIEEAGEALIDFLNKEIRISPEEIEMVFTINEIINREQDDE